MTGSPNISPPPPVGKAEVGGQDQGSLLVAGLDQLKEQAGPSGCDRKKADLGDDQERGMARAAHLDLQATGSFGRDQMINQCGQGDPVDPFAGLDRSTSKGGGQMGLAGSGRAQ